MPPLTPIKKNERGKKKRTPRREYNEYKNVDRAFEAAIYYGFTPLALPISVTKEDQEKAKALEEKEAKSRCSCHAEPSLEEKIALLRVYQDQKFIDGPQPVLFCEELPGRKKNEKRLGLDILGAGKSITEAMLIQTARAILKDEGFSDISLSINSVGDRDCGARFIRELTAYYRKHIADLPASCRASLRKNPTELFACSHEKCRLLGEDAPKAIAFLSESSRMHFKEVLEYLEELEIPYRMDPFLVGNRAVTAETVFEIRDASSKDKTLLCVGSRYNSLARRLGVKKDIPGVGAVLFLPTTGAKDSRIVKRLRVPKPSIFFLQLGFKAKLKSLNVIEVLREIKVPLHQALARDRLISQIGSAENMKIPYSIIIGQKEAMENSVIVRNAATRAQETVKTSALQEYLKKMKLV